MSHFYGTVRGQSSGEATRRGSRNSGLRVTAASWQGAVYTYLWHDDETGKDHYRVELGPWERQWSRQANPSRRRDRIGESI
jgi:hypothetical protein